MIEKDDLEMLDLRYKLRKECDSDMKKIDAMLSEGAVNDAKLNTKVNAILWGLGAVFTAVISVLVKLVFNV
jgi:hypothetical protein